MEEVKLRTHWINEACTRQQMPGLLAKEFSHLQLRMICELIAIGCLTISSDTSNIKNLEKQWSAQEIIPRLDRLNPHSFPKACTVVELPGGRGLQAEDVTPAPLDKAGFLHIYGRCGGHLHRGHLKRLLASIPPAPINLDDISTYTKRIYDLMNVHRIASADYRKHYFCRMENTPGGKCAMITSEVRSQPPQAFPAAEQASR